MRSKPFFHVDCFIFRKKFYKYDETCHIYYDII